jgi:LSD1 subclass zinc finger protein
MPEKIHCPSCRAALQATPEVLGRTVRCSNCQTTFIASTDTPAEPEGIVKEPSRPPRRPARPPEEDDDFPPEDEEDRLRRRGRRRQGTAAAASAVAGPAIALMIVGGIVISLSILRLVLNMNLLDVRSLTAAANPKRMAGPQQADSVAGRVGGSLFGICYGGIIMTGAMKMKSLSNHGYAMTSCIVAMLPCSLCCLLGLPFGIWGLIVLNRPEVAAQFTQHPFDSMDEMS